MKREKGQSRRRPEAFKRFTVVLRESAHTRTHTTGGAAAAAATFIHQTKGVSEKERAPTEKSMTPSARQRDNDAGDSRSTAAIVLNE